MIYLDNNATSLMPPVVKQAMMKWCNQGNPSAGYSSALAVRSMMEEFRAYIARLCGFEQPGALTAGGSANQYKILFTSGASESNCTFVHGVVTAYAMSTGNKPHIVISAVEHKSLLDMVIMYVSRGVVTATFVAPTPSGHVRPEDVGRAIISNTCLVCVMHANNETGAINDIKRIGAIAHKHNVPFYSDTVQTFGKFPVNPIMSNLDGFCISFHKLHGPPGVGALIIKQQLIAGYKLGPIIFGTQNDGLRGGTENVPGIGAALAATKYTMENRAAKNAMMGKIKHAIMVALAAALPCRQFAGGAKLSEAKRATPIEIVFLSGEEQYLPNTLMLAIIGPRCNVQVKNALEKKNIIISVGSACNTSSEKASHVINAMGADDAIRKGALRITLGDETTMVEARIFVKEFLAAVK